MRRKRIEALAHNVVLVANPDQLEELTNWLTNCDPLLLDNMPAWMEEIVEIVVDEIGDIDLLVKTARI